MHIHLAGAATGLTVRPSQMKSSPLRFQGTQESALLRRITERLPEDYVARFKKDLIFSANVGHAEQHYFTMTLLHNIHDGEFGKKPFPAAREGGWAETKDLEKMLFPIFGYYHTPKVGTKLTELHRAGFIHLAEFNEDKTHSQYVLALTDLGKSVVKADMGL